MADHDFESLLLLIDTELDGLSVDVMTRAQRLLHAARVNVRAHLVTCFTNPPDGIPPPSDLRLILAGIEEIKQAMTDLTTAEADEATAVAAVLAEFKVLSGELTTLSQELQTALAAGDTAAVQQAATQFEASAKALNLAVQTAIAADPNTPKPPAITITPTSISGVAGTAVSGNMTAEDPTGAAVPGTWAFTDAPPDIAFNAAGSFSGTPAAAEAGDIVIVFTPSAAGSTPVDGSLTYTITAAAPAP